MRDEPIRQFNDAPLPANIPVPSLTVRTQRLLACLLDITHVRAVSRNQPLGGQDSQGRFRRF